MMVPWIKIIQMEKEIDGFTLGPVDLSIEPGTITALVGDNGSGKSTLLKMLMGMAKPDKGEISIFGKDVNREDISWKKKLAFVPQTNIGWNAFTGEQLKKMICPLYGKWDEALFEKMVAGFNIPLNKRFAKMSQGMQQKLSLALALPRKTDVLLLDEPTSSLDMSSKKFFMDLLVDWMDEEERAIILTSHQADDLKKLADYLFVIGNGKQIGKYEKEALLESYRTYWISGKMPESVIPGEMERKQQQILTSKPDEAEYYLNGIGAEILEQSSLDLEEIITLILSKKEGG